MPPIEQLPNDQAEVVFTDHSIEWMANHLTKARRAEVFDRIVTLFQNPAGKHALGNRDGSRLAGCSTLEADGRELRVVYMASSKGGVGLVEIIAVGPRRGSEVYDMASALVASGKLTDAESTQIWDALQLLDDERQRLGLETWDYFEGPAAPGLIASVVNAGLMREEDAKLLRERELIVAMQEGWGADGPDPGAALRAALREVSLSTTPERALQLRREDRCGAYMPRAGKLCIRVQGHHGAHRSHR